MNGNFFAIKVLTIEGDVVYINVENISAIKQLTDGAQIWVGIGSGFITKASVDEVYAAATKYCTSLAKDTPEVGFPKDTPAVEAEMGTEPKAETETEKENSVSSKVGKILEKYRDRTFFGRYSDMEDMLQYIPDIYVSTKDGITIHVSDIYESNGKCFIRNKEGQSFSIDELSDDSSAAMIGTITDQLIWEKAYMYADCEISDSESVEIHNRFAIDKYRIHPNTEENLNAFGLSAGELMKSMVDGKYRKDDPYITLVKGEIVSIEGADLYEKYIEVGCVADWIYDHPEEVKADYPHIYEKVFA